MPITVTNEDRMKAVEDKLSEAQKLITQAFSIMQYINTAQSTVDSSNASGLYVGQYTTPTPIASQADSAECQD